MGWRPRSPELMLLSLVFLGPVVAALLLYYGPWGLGWLPRLPAGGRELIDPPLALPPAFMELLAAEDERPGPPYRWALIYARITPCEEQCVQHLRRLHQVHLALGRDSQRLRRVYLHGGSAPRVALDPDLVLARLDDAAGTAVLDLLGAERFRSGRVYIVDPLGNLIARYPADVEQRRLLEDLERLLGLSRVG